MSIPLASIAAQLKDLTAVSFPRTLGKLSTLMTTGDPSAGVLAAIIASDPMLGAVMLGRASTQSAQANGGIGNAVRVLGIGSVEDLVKSVQPIPEKHRETMAACWRQANSCAMLCRILGRRISAISELDEETWHSLGLIHDLGGILARLHFSEEYQRAEARLAAGDGPFSLMLTEELGASPGLLGSLWAHIFNLPPRLITGLRYQEAPDLARDDPLPAAALHVARNLVRGLGFTVGEDVYIDTLRPNSLALLGLGSLDLEMVIDEFLTEMDQMELFESTFMQDSNRRQV